MNSDLLDILVVVRTELLDPQWGQHRSDVINPVEDESLRIVAEKLLEPFNQQSPAILQFCRIRWLHEDECLMHYPVIQSCSW